MKRLWQWFTEAVTAARIAYVVGLITSGGVGHCVAIASVAPRVDKVEAELAEVRQHVASDRRVLDRVEGMVSAVVNHLGVKLPPDVPPTQEVPHE
jgi:hypothetical protein